MRVMWCLSLWLAKSHSLIYAYSLCSEYRSNRERFWFKPPGDASHSCNSNPGANVIRPQFSKSEKLAESTLSQPAAVLKQLSLLAEIHQTEGTDHSETNYKQRKHAAEQTKAYFHRLLPFAFSAASQKISWDCVRQGEESSTKQILCACL